MLNNSTKAIYRWFNVIFAFCLSSLLIMSFASNIGLTMLMKQWDFLGLWLLSLTLLSLPLLYLEIGLARRSQTTVVQALSALTRDADTTPVWRAIGWCGVLFISFLAGALLHTSSVQLQALFNIEMTTIVALVICLVISLVLSFVPRLILLGLLMVGIIISFFIPASPSIQPEIQHLSWQWTAISGKEWAISVVLALFSTGLGMSLYWQNIVTVVDQQRSSSVYVLPIFIALVLAGVMYAFVPNYILLANIILVALLLQLARQQWQDRQLAFPLVWLLSLVGIVPWFLVDVDTSHYLMTVLVIWGLLLCLVYSIFAGWMMKASHLRKALHFNHELVYNIWRVAVRIVIPISIVLAFVFMML